MDQPSEQSMDQPSEQSSLEAEAREGQARPREDERARPPEEEQAPAREADLRQERDARAARLAHVATSGSITLGEYAARAAELRRARTADELDSALAGLPDAATGPTAAHRSWLFGVFGGTDQRGRWRLSRRLRVICLLGGAHLDLSSAQAEGQDCTITAVAVLGGVDIVAPAGVQVLLSGVSLFGGRSDERSSGLPLPGAPVIRVRSFAFLGGVTVKQADEA